MLTKGLLQKSEGTLMPYGWRGAASKYKDRLCGSLHHLVHLLCCSQSWSKTAVCIWCDVTNNIAMTFQQHLVHCHMHAFSFGQLYKILHASASRQQRTLAWTDDTNRNQVVKLTSSSVWSKAPGTSFTSGDMKSNSIPTLASLPTSVPAFSMDCTIVTATCL